MNTTFISKVIILTFLISCIGIIPFVPNAEAATPQTYTIKLEPTFDSWIDYGYKTWHNDTTSLDFDGLCCGSTSKWRDRTVIEWNTSAIPDNAVITNASINITYTSCSIDNNAYHYITNITNQPSKTGSALTVWNDCIDGSSYDDCYSRRGAKTGAHTYEFNTSGTGDSTFDAYDDPLYNLQNYLTEDWFAIGTYGRSDYSYRRSEGSIASIENPSSDPIILWVEYTYNGPYIDNPSPSNGATEVSAQPNTCIDLEHPSGTNMDIEWQWYNTSSSAWETYGTNTTITNGTYCQQFLNATLSSTTYQWRILANDSYGNWTNRTFSFTTAGVFPPSDLSCSRNSSTSINVTWTECPDGAGTTHTLVYYSLGFGAPTYTSGILGANTTNEYAIIEGLDNAECYSFGLYTNYEDSEGNWTLSSRNSLSPCCTSGGTYRFYIRYENTSFADDGDGNVESTDFYNNLINLSKFNCSEHMLEVHYANYATEYWYINSSLWENPTAMNYSYLEISTLYNPLYFVFHWNYSIYATNNDSYTCPCNYTCSYSRTLLPAAGYRDTNWTNITFYFIVDRHIYNDYYVDSADCNTSVEYEYNDNLAHYKVWFEDRTGIFEPRRDYDSYATFYAYNATDTKLIVHQQYFDGDFKVHPTLLYNKDYGVGVNCSAISSDAYELIGYFKGRTTVSPDQETMLIVPKYTSTINYDAFTVDYGYTGANLLWVYFYDSDSHVSNINLTVRYETNNTIVYQHDVNSNENNFTIPGTDNATAYIINITLVHSEYGTMYIQFYTGTYRNPLTTATELNDLLRQIFGQLPENLDTGEEMQWYLIPMFFIALIPLSLFGAKYPPIAAFGVGGWMILFSVIVSGIPIALAGMGVFLIVIGIFMAFARGGRF